MSPENPRKRKRFRNSNWFKRSHYWYIKPSDPERNLIETLGRMACRRDEKDSDTYHFMDSNGKVVLTIKRTYEELQESEYVMNNALSPGGDLIATQMASVDRYSNAGKNFDQLLFKIHGVAAEASRTPKK